MPAPTTPTSDGRDPPEWDETRISARLPSLDVDIRHRRAWDSDAEQVQVMLTTVPPFEASARLFEMANPALFWMRMAQAAWAPWLALLAPPRSRRD